MESLSRRLATTSLSLMTPSFFLPEVLVGVVEGRLVLLPKDASRSVALRLTVATCMRCCTK